MKEPVISIDLYLQESDYIILKERIKQKNIEACIARFSYGNKYFSLDTAYGSVFLSEVEDDETVDQTELSYIFDETEDYFSFLKELFGMFL